MGARRTDRPPHQVAAERGLSESRLSQARMQALEFLRAHRAGEMLA